MFHSLGEYVNSEEHLRNALQIKREIGDKHREAACYANLGIYVLRCLGEYVEAEEYLRKALQITIEISDKGGEATCYLNLGDVLY